MLSQSKCGLQNQTVLKVICHRLWKHHEDNLCLWPLFIIKSIVTHYISLEYSHASSSVRVVLRHSGALS